MGNHNNKTQTKNINENPAPTQTEDNKIKTNDTQPKYVDLPKKRKFAEFLLSNDLNIFKRNLQEVRQLNDEQFNQLFEGNVEYNYNTSNEKSFKQLAQKFEDNNDLIMEVYSNEKYYKWASQIWRPNILQKLKETEDEGEKDAILKKHKIDISNWDEDFMNIFTIIVNIAPIKTLAERMKNYFQVDYGDFDELIKTVEVCKKTINKNDESHCNKVLEANLNTSISRIIQNFVPKFMNNIKTEIQKLPEQFAKKEEQMAINSILNSHLSKSNEKKLIKKVQKIYEEKTSYSFLGFTEEYKKLKELSFKFNNNELKYDCFQGRVRFKEMKFSDKVEMSFSNKTIKHAILGLSVVNLTYSVMHLTKTFLDYDKFKVEFREKLNQIRQKFIRHQKEVQLISEDIDEAITQIIDCGKKFQQDSQEVEDLISSINDAINGVKNEKNKSILNLLGSSGGIAIGVFGATVTEGDDSIEYATASFADVFAFASNCVDLSIQKKAIKTYTDYLTEAQNLKNEIIAEIDKLRQKFYELSGKHFT